MLSIRPFFWSNKKNSKKVFLFKWKSYSCVIKSIKIMKNKTNTATKIQFRIAKSFVVGKPFIKVTKTPMVVYISKAFDKAVKIGEKTKIQVTKLEDKKGKQHVYRVKRDGSRRTYYILEKDLF